MNIICDTSLLAAAIDGVSRAITQRSALPVLEGILMKAEGFSLTLTGYDMEIGITTTIEANVRESGEIVLNARLLGDMVHRLSSPEIHLEVEDSGNVHVQGGNTEFDISSMAASDYPLLPSPGAEHTLSLPASLFKEMVEKTIYAVSQDTRKPAHTGELFVIEPNSLTVVALDGYRLAIIQREIAAQKEIRIIIPAKTLNEISKLVVDENEEIAISANRRYVVFQVAGYTVLSRLIEGEFLNYLSVIPEGWRTRVLIETQPFINTIERASLIINDRQKNPLRVTFDKNVTVRCQTPLGRVLDELDAQIEGEPVEIGFNNRYLLDALRNARCEKVALEISGPLSPVKLLPAEGEDFTYLVLPVRFKNEE